MLSRSSSCGSCGDIVVLRTAKVAMVEGLLQPSDFYAVKNAFLKTQQIKVIGAPRAE